MSRYDMREERREGTKWWLWVMGLIVLTTIVFAGLKYAGVFTDTVVEREVFEQSYQRTEAINTQIATLEAQKTELVAQLQNPNLDEATKANINSQLAAIRIQLDTAKRKQR